MLLEQVPADYLVLIGGIITQFNLLDNLLTVILIELTGNDCMEIKAHIPFANMNFGTKKVLLDLLIKTRENIPAGSPLSSYESTLQKDLDSVQAKRNAVAHSIWVKESGRIVRRRFRAKGKVAVETIGVEKEELVGILAELDSCLRRFRNMTFQFKAESGIPQKGQNAKGEVAKALSDANTSRLTSPS